MAIYVLSDVHGRLAALDRLLSRLSLGEDDWLYVLGDMVDRGANPAGVMRLVHSLDRTTTLMGNHEQLMLDALVRGREDLDWFNWSINGCETTVATLNALPTEEMTSLLEWALELPLYAHAQVGERPYLLVHAGIRHGAVEPPETWDEEGREGFLSAQDPEDLLWIREEHWFEPTGLIDEQGRGPVVISGHTPTLLIDDQGLAFDPDAPWESEREGMSILHLGACEATGGVADRIAIDCGAGAGQGIGRLAAIRLDDGEIFYEAVHDDE